MKARKAWMRLAGLLLLTFSFASVAHGQTAGYPNRPVTVISDSAPGSAPDVVLRFFTEGLSKLWGQQVIVLNHPGANGSIAARAASEAGPDGYTLFVPAASTLIALPTVAPNLPVKIPRDFLAVGFLANQPMFLAVSPSLGVKTLPELIAKAKAQPGEISIALSGIGRTTHMTAVLLEERAQIDLLVVPYAQRGPASAAADLGSGRVSTIIEGYSGIIGPVKAGQVKLIATAAAKRLPEFPDLPTVAETIPDFSAAGWTIMAAPVGTSAALVNKVNADLNKVASDRDLQAKLAALGNYTQIMTPDETQAFVIKQQDTWQPVLQRIFAEVGQK
jgi:tripartite-type tricarboxylate transporter receptor subunit TctC